MFVTCSGIQHKFGSTGRVGLGPLSVGGDDKPVCVCTAEGATGSQVNYFCSLRIVSMNLTVLNTIFIGQRNKTNHNKTS